MPTNYKYTTNLRMAQGRGFTLFEVLIAITVGAVLLSLVLSIYNLSLRSLSSSENRSELTQNSRLIIERLTRDIRQTRGLATILPAEDGLPALPPPNELEMQDGHNVDFHQYIRYYLSGTDIKRQIRRYYFPSDPEILVPFDAEDDFGNPPQVNILEDELVGQYVTALKFYGVDLITVDLTLTKSSVAHTTSTAIFGRNL